MNHCYPEYKQIVRLIDDEKNNCDLDYDLNALLKEKYPEIADACPLEFMGGMEISVKTPTHFAKFQGIISTTNDFFNLFPVDVTNVWEASLLMGMNQPLLLNHWQSHFSQMKITREVSCHLQFYYSNCNCRY